MGISFPDWAVGLIMYAACFSPSAEDLTDDLPAPPPPVRTTSLGISPTDDRPHLSVSTNLSVSRSDSQASSAASTSSG